MSNIENKVEAAAVLLEKYSVDMAKSWREQPFNRVTLARAFAMGLLGDKPLDSDPHPDALSILTTAYSDQAIRSVVADARVFDLDKASPFGFVLLLEDVPIANSEHPMEYDDKELDKLELRHMNSSSVYRELLEMNQDDVGIYKWIVDNSELHMS